MGLVVSPVRRMDGRPGSGLLPFDGDEHLATVDVRAHRGLVGDRYFGTRFPSAAVTLIAAEQVERVHDELSGLFGLDPFDPLSARRNVVIRGLDVDALVRHSFTLDAGHGPVRFRSRSAASPCGWMDEVFAPGAHRALRGRAGIRCEPLDDGTLSVGPARLTDVRPWDPRA